MSEPDFAPDRRLHPLSWLFVLLASIKQFIVPVIVAIVFGAGVDGRAWGALVVIPLVIAAIWRQWLFRYGFGPRGLVIRDGLLFRNVRQIEYERIENIDTQRGLLHRFLDVAEVRLESSTGGKPEALIRVLGLDAVQELRDRIFATAPQAQAPKAAQSSPQAHVLLRLSPTELMRYGFVDNRGMIAVGALFGLAAQLDVMRGVTEFFGWGVSEYFGSQGVTDAATAREALSLSLAMVALGVFVTVFLFVHLLSVFWALVTLHDFTVSRHDADLRIRYGLLTRFSVALRLQRIQAVHRTESMMHRFFGRVSLSVDLAGDDGHQVNDGGMPRARMRWLAPICTPGHAEELIRIALPMLADDTAPQWQPLAPGTRGRIFRKFVVFATLVCAAPAIYWFGFAAPALWLAIAPLGWLHATQYVRRTRWALTREALLFQRGWLTRQLTIVPRNRVQVVGAVASPFDRRWQTATLVVDTAGAFGRIMRIAYLSQDAVRMLTDALYGAARERTMCDGAASPQSVG